MLIRSQDKTIIVNIDNAFSIAIRDINGAASIYVGSQGSCCIIAEYSTKTKVMKVLDMIQEAYADAELIPMTVPNIGKMFAEASASKENELLAEAIGEVLMNKMVFQMPADSEVKV
jgi:hypothetical protein